MSGRSFLDSHVLVYTDDHGNPGKQEAALALVERCRARRDGVVSVQVLQEYFAVTTRKLGVDAGIARRKVELFGRLHLAVTSLDDVLAAIDLHRLHHLAFWDALVVRSALRAGCSILYSEDLSDRRRFDGLEVVNPFRS